MACAELDGHTPKDQAVLESRRGKSSSVFTSWRSPSQNDLLVSTATSVSRSCLGPFYSHHEACRPSARGACASCVVPELTDPRVNCQWRKRERPLRRQKIPLLAACEIAWQPSTGEADYLVISDIRRSVAAVVRGGRSVLLASTLRGIVDSLELLER